MKHRAQGIAVIWNLSGYEASSSGSGWDRDWYDEWDDELDFDENTDLGTEDTLAPENNAPIQKSIPQISKLRRRLSA